MKWRYEHYRNIDGGCITLAMVDEDDGMSLFSYALCSPKQRFSKKIGRDIARGRGESGNWSTKIETSKTGRAQFRKALERLLIGAMKNESWVVRSQWLRNYVHRKYNDLMTPDEWVDLIVRDHLKFISK